MNRGANDRNLAPLLSVYVSWICISILTPQLNRLIDFQRINPYLLPVARMTLMFLVTYVFVRTREKASFSSGFNFRFREIARNFGWALAFFAVAAVVLGGYQLGVVMPLTERVLTASASPAQASIPPFDKRVIQYVYVVYEGIIEVLIFIGFLFDRLARRLGLFAAIIVGNVAFALWHYDYWRAGWLNGTLMVFLSFLVGVITSLSYYRTKNSLSPIFCHTFIDTPNAIRELLGMI